MVDVKSRCCPPWLLRCTHHHARQSAVCSQQAPIGAADNRACSCGADFPIFYGIKIVVTLAVLSPPRVPTPAPTQCQGLLRLLSMRFLATPKVLSPLSSYRTTRTSTCLIYLQARPPPHPACPRPLLLRGKDCPLCRPSHLSPPQNLLCPPPLPHRAVPVRWLSYSAATIPQ